MREETDLIPSGAGGDGQHVAEGDASETGSRGRLRPKAAITLEGARVLRDASLPSACLINGPYGPRHAPVTVNTGFAFSVTSGRPIETMLNGQPNTIPNGVLALIEPNSIIASRPQTYGFRSIVVDQEVVVPMLDELMRAERFFDGGITLFPQPELATEFARAADLLSGSGPPLEREEGLHRFLCLVARSSPRHRSGRDESVAAVRLRRARDYLDTAAQAAENPSLNELATVAGISKFGLLRAFKHAFGITPHAYLVQKRLNRAQTLMRRGASVTEAAVLAGFADKSHLTRQFRNTLGVTPGSLRIPNPGSGS